MTNYDNISKAIGERNWQNSITHDNGQFSVSGGGKSTLALSQPGYGKSTLFSYRAQMSRCLHGEKSGFVSDLLAREPLEKWAGKVFQETVIWRARDQDNFANIIPENWYTSFKGSMGSIKNLYVWVHERDKEIIFYSYNHKRQEIPVLNLPPPIYYHDAEDIMRRLKWGAINVVLEPQTYSLSHTLIQRLREKKMDISEEEDRDRERKRAQKSKSGHRVKSTKNTQTAYEKREISPSYFWFDMIHVAKRMNKYRHILISIDEVDDVFEARSEGDVWKLIEMLANDWKDLRKSNISMDISTHETDFIDWRILKRVDYFIWMAGASVHGAYSMIKLQNLVSDLPIGTFLIEKRKMDFGLNIFGKIPFAQPSVRIEGLKGEDFNLSPSATKKLLDAYDAMWSDKREEEIINLDEPEEQKIIEPEVITV